MTGEEFVDVDTTKLYRFNGKEWVEVKEEEGENK